MSYQEDINDEFTAILEESMQVAEQVQAYNRKLMAPVWHKRRELVKKIPGFWGQTIGNSPMFALEQKDNDVEALDNMTDFHVEFDDKRPNYRKVVATFKKNDVFKNETLTKEFSIDPEEEGTVISKTTIEYHDGKKPNNKRKADEDDFAISLLDWFGDDDVRTGIILTEDIFPSAVDYYQGEGEEDDDEEIDLEEDSEEEEEEEEVKPKTKKSRK